MLVVFAMSFRAATLGTAPAFRGARVQFWAHVSEWLLLAGILMGSIAGAILVALWNLLLRLAGDPAAAVVPFGIVHSALVVGIFLVTGWLGGELVLRRHAGGIEAKREARSSIVALSNTTVDVSRVGDRRTRL